MMSHVEMLGLPKLLVASSLAAALGCGCATVPSPDSMTVAAAAVAATAAADAAAANSAPAAGAPSAAAPLNGANRSGASGSVVAAAAAAAAAAVAGQQKPFADIVKEAKEHPGFLNVYTKEEKVWIEIRPEQFDRPFFMQVNRTHGVGERDPFTNPMLRSYIVEFHRLGNNIQLLAKNSHFFAKEGTPLARAVRESSSDS